MQSYKSCWKVFDVNDAWSQNVLVMVKTNRFHFVVGLHSDNAERMSKHGKNIRHANQLQLVVYFFVLIIFWHCLCVSKAQCMAKWNLFVNCMS